MATITSLWLPILVSAVFVFVASSIIHMVFTYHYKDFKKAQDEDKLMDFLRGLKIPPGEYLIPYAGGPKAMKSPEFQEKMNKGPGLIMTVWPGGRPAMGANLVQWFIYTIIVGTIVAYVTGRSLLETSADYMMVFKIAAVTAFACYTVAHWQDSIWFKRSWGRTFRGIIDGVVYALLTAGTFGWLWPR